MNYSTMDQETVNFISFMNNMKESHFSLSGSCFSLPEHLIAQAADETLPSEAKAAVDDMHVQTSEFVSNQEFVLKTATDAYTDTKDLENFKAEMRKQKEEAKKKAADQIDAYYARMTNIGIKNPKSRKSIIFFAKTVGDFLSNVFGKIRDFVVKLTQKIVKWFKKAFQKVKSFFQGAASTVGNLFRNLFSKKQREIEYYNFLILLAYNTDISEVSCENTTSIASETTLT